MTIKEVARDLGVSESYIYGLIKDGVIDYHVVGRLDYPVCFVLDDDGVNMILKHQLAYKKHIEIDPEEVEYIDWYINVGRGENQNIRIIARENHDFQKQNRRKMTIEVYY